MGFIQVNAHKRYMLQNTLYINLMFVLFNVQIPSQEMGSLDDDLDDLPGLSKSRRSFQAL